MVGKGKIQASISRSASSESFLLLKPAVSGNSDATAKAIALCKGVKKVYLTSGKYGFVVAVNGSKGTHALSKQLRRSVKLENSHIVNAHFSYRP